MGLGELLGGMIDKEGIVRGQLQTSFEQIAEENGLTFKDLFYMIKPINEEFDFKCFVYKLGDKGQPIFVREILLKEIIDG